MSEMNIPGYLRQTWAPKANAAQKNNWENILMPLILQGYDESKNNHLYPISLKNINESRGAWTNDNIP
jgi:hypothetical protein